MSDDLSLTGYVRRAPRIQYGRDGAHLSFAIAVYRKRGAEPLMYEVQGALVNDFPIPYGSNVVLYGEFVETTTLKGDTHLHYRAEYIDFVDEKPRAGSDASRDLFESGIPAGAPPDEVLADDFDFMSI